ncbi:helix-turn-helix domain-containing protein [Acidithiobacillus caldus]|uniref:HTH cro/C1-type domain-containing protein n=1 Tax=Acidithiobacillus caldus TaxID=33059 RepID=A0A1E7YTJ3_9PROT|nr:helix-turn-helix transcriptional regulator [Acidithiobacillus caldus]OFC36909.1 hypothetical protein BAE27_05130 [Acidithiobacillus caldus]OFC39510.1 hypothetical protein BAE28_03210 [Acidithiobacillus caldus]OFC39748.1 hypothetical protein BAE29_06665 [Acidithiobacillus caldus]OFC54353.1 hypothetical protein BAE30_11320 [Acidithiobacillus caldus]
MGVLDKFIEESRDRDVYLVEKAKLDFAFSLEEQRRLSGKKPADIAKALKVSRAYISKVFRGDVNFTIESMVKLARAVGAELTVRATPAPASVDWATIAANPNANNTNAIPVNSVVSIKEYKLTNCNTGIAA